LLKFLQQLIIAEVSALQRLGTRYPCPWPVHTGVIFDTCVHGRAMSMAREHGCDFGHSCSWAVNTAHGCR